MTWLLLAGVALTIAAFGRLRPLRLLRRLTGALLILAVACLVRFAVVLAGDPEPWAVRADVLPVLALGYLAARGALVALFEWLLAGRLRLETPRLARDVVALILYLVVAAGILHAMLGIQVGALLTTSAVLTVVIGLALQETLGTLLAGLALSWEHRLDGGEWVEVGGRVGQVEELGWRSLVLRTVLGERILIPNSEVARSRLRLLGQGREPVGVAVRLGVAYAHAPERVTAVLESVCRDLPLAVADPPSVVLTAEFADSAIIYECRCWTRQPWREAALRSQLLTRAWSALARSGMEIPFPQRTVHLAPRKRPEAGDSLLREALAACDLFHGLPEDALESLSGGSRLLRFAPSETVIREGDASHSLFVLAAGRAVVSRRGTEVGRLDPGQVFGEMAFLTGSPRSATVRAEGVLKVVEVDSAALADLLRQSPELADDLARRVSQRQDAAQALDRPQGTDAPQEESLVGWLKRRLLRLIGTDE